MAAMYFCIPQTLEGKRYHNFLFLVCIVIYKVCISVNFTLNRNILFVLTGEDEVSFSHHTKALQAEFKKTHHNLQIVDKLMSSSFAL